MVVLRFGSIVRAACTTFWGVRNGTGTTLLRIPANAALVALLLHNATPSVFHQRHIGRVLRSPCNSRGRRLASSRGREPRAGRCPPLWPGDVRNDEGRVALPGADGSEA